MWEIEEHASKGRINDWFKAINVPTIRFKEATNNIISVGHNLLILIIIIKDGSFWIVKIKKIVYHVITEITAGTQKWIGALPSLIKIATINNMVIHMLNLIENRLMIDSIIIADLTAWIKKYLIVISVFELIGEFNIIGKRDKRLISILNHKSSQLGEVNVIVIDNTRTTEKSSEFGNGFVIIIY